MAKRTIKIRGISSIESLKIEILRQLKINDHHKNCLPEFNSRLQTYLSCHTNETTRLIIDLENVKSTIKTKVESKIIVVRYPNGFELGQPHMMWGTEPDWRTQEEKEKVKAMTDKEFARLEEEIANLSRIKKFITTLAYLTN